MGELRTADHLVVIGRGRLVADTSVAELLASTSPAASVRAPRNRRQR